MRLELQADFYAGHVGSLRPERASGCSKPGDIDEALNAASAIGDDRLQMQAQGYVVPDSFTHGTSEQRSRWFKLGYKTGDFSRGRHLLGRHPLAGGRRCLGVGVTLQPCC